MNKAMADHPKLARRLKRALLLTLTAVLILATLAAGIFAYLEASDNQDESLLSVAKLVESNQMSAAADDEIFDDDDYDDSAIRVWELGRKHRRSISFKKKIKPGFDTVHEDDEFWRVYVTEKNRTGKQFIVAQQLSVSAELALTSAKNTALPLLLLFLVVPLLVTWIVRHSFKPLNILAGKLQRSNSLQLDVDDKHNIPVELMPFIFAIDTLLEKNESYNQRQRRFIADAAHELRTPIAALTLQIDNVQSATDEQSKRERQAALTQSIHRLQRLVNQLLDLARAQSGLTRSESIVSFNEQVKSQISELYPLAEQKNLDLCVSRNEPANILDNNNQIQHLIRNALSNAIKFTPEHGTIDIAIFKEGKLAVLKVTDSGPGVPPDQLEKLHQPFYRSTEQASGFGAGLGLAICHEIAALLNGKLTLENIQPNGMVFCYRQKAVDSDK